MEAEEEKEGEWRQRMRGQEVGRGGGNEVEQGVRRGGGRGGKREREEVIPVV